jgi:hypothetical protein
VRVVVRTVTKPSPAQAVRIKQLEGWLADDRQMITEEEHTLETPRRSSGPSRTEVEQDAANNAERERCAVQGLTC